MNRAPARYRTGLSIGFLPLLILCAVVFMTSFASPAAASLFENRTGVFWSSEAGFAGVEGALNAGLHRVYKTFSYDFVPGSLVASKNAGKWSRAPKSIQDQMTLDAAQKGAGRKIIDNLGDPKFKGMEKWEYKVKSANGQDSVVHYVRDPNTGKLMDFKFTKHSTDTIKPWGNDPVVPPGE